MKAQSHSQQDPTFRTTLAFTRLTAEQAIKQLRGQGFADEVLPSRSCMAQVLNRNGYRLRPVLKAKPQKKSQKPTPSSPTSNNISTFAKAKPSCA
jgi:Rhodopirellula transposase DDE domain